MKLTNEDKQFLELYSDSEYQKPSVTVDAVIFRLTNKETNNYRKLPEKKLQVYLSKRQYSPFKNAYALPGTFIDLNIELSDSIKECVKKKVCLNDFYFEQLFTFGEKSRDPRSRVLSVSYLLLTRPDESLENGEWFDVDIINKSNKTELLEDGYNQKFEIDLSLTNDKTTLNNTIEVLIKKNGINQVKNIQTTFSDLAFDHAKILYFAIERLKNKLEYTDIIFNLFNKHFTLTELKQGYEEILGEKLLDANFRRKTSKYVIATNEYVIGKGHRSSRYFTHNPLWSTNNLD